MVLLTILTIALVLILVAVLVVALVRIDSTLERIGGGALSYMGEHKGDQLSLLSKARWGVRAIEVQTSAIEPEVARLNQGLQAIDGGLGAIRDGLRALIEALRRQGGAR